MKNTVHNNGSYAIAAVAVSAVSSTIPYRSCRPKTNHLRYPLLHIARTLGTI